MLRNYTLKQPARRHARIGAFYASVLPIIIGLLIMSGAFGTMNYADRSVSLPVALTFLLGAPLVAIISQSIIAKRQKIDFWNVVEVSLITATVMQIAFGTLYIIVYALTADTDPGFTYLISTSLAIHAIFWFILTVPITLLCALIFRLSALRPIYG